MIGAAHAVAPEDLMALLDGELAGDEARVVAAHVEACAECGELVRQFQAVSRSMVAWTVEDVPTAVDEAGMSAAESAGKTAKPRRTIGLSFWNWRLWAIGGSGVVAAIVISVIFVAISSTQVSRKMAYIEPDSRTSGAQPSTASEAIDQQAIPLKGKSESMNSLVALQSGVVGGKGDRYKGDAVAPQPEPVVEEKREALNYARAQEKSFSNGGGGGGEQAKTAGPAPMIARTVSLTLLVKDVPAARAVLDGILARRAGYAAQLTVATPEGGARSFQASLRIPAGELAAALVDLRALGRVENEGQSGEEVTQQHADLVARLQNSRETEQRMRDILSERTGKIEEVLQVEEEIARVRGEIEGMEADQKTLEHRVDFASVDLQMTEVYKEQLGSPSPSVGNRVRNSFVTGLRNAGASLLGMLLFLEEVGPVLLIWMGLLGVPGWLLWRRYRRVRDRV